ncbi:MAG TPA: Wzz/FepE/Etk N-terminal domain-containing protein [Gaiellaceae bacterium]
MSPEESRGQAPAGFDPEAEQEVDFGRYWRLLGAHWWLLAAGLVLGALVGYTVSLGGKQTYQATATLYLGQPYSASGNIALQTLQTNPSTVKAIIHAASVIDGVAGACATSPASFLSGISTQSVSGNLSKNGQTPLITVTVKAKKRKPTACAANGLARQVVDRTSAYANQKIAYDRRQVSTDELAIAAIKQALAGAGTSSTDKLLLLLQLSSRQSDLSSVSQLLLQTTQVEAPKLVAPAAPERVTARSRRNSVVIAALIGLILGAIAALGWDGAAAGFSKRRIA